MSENEWDKRNLIILLFVKIYEKIIITYLVFKFLNLFDATIYI